MNNLVKLSYISKLVFRPSQFARHISTSKHKQEVCVPSAEITEQETVIFYKIKIYK